MHKKEGINNRANVKRLPNFIILFSFNSQSLHVCILYIQMHGRMDGWMDGWQDGWIDGWMEDKFQMQMFRDADNQNILRNFLHLKPFF